MAKSKDSSPKDPAALAFSAVENALVQPVETSAAEDKPAAKSKASKNSPKPTSRTRSAERIAERAAGIANDDRSSATGILYSLQSKPNNTPYWVALLASIIWGGIIGVLGAFRYADTIANTELLSATVRTPEFAAYVALLVIPILAFFAIAVMTRRANDLRLAASTMTQAAMRLTEPEATASQQIKTVGQAVRREVNAIGDGLDRALSRASELEVMVHNEVNSLERTYADNELRMRALIEELAAQRHAVVTNSDRVRDAISDVHSDFSNQLETVGSEFVSQMKTVGGDITSTIELQSATAKSAVEAAGLTIDGAIADRTSSFENIIQNRQTDLETSLEDSVEKLNIVVDERTAALASAVATRSSELDEILLTRTGELDQSLQGRTDALNQSLDSRTQHFDNAISTRTTELETALESRTDHFNQLVSERSESVAELIAQKTSSFTASFDEKADLLTSALNNGSEAFTGQVDNRILALTSTFEDGASTIAASVDTESAKLSSVLRATGESVLVGMSLRGEEISEQLETMSGKLSDGILGNAENAQAQLSTFSQRFDETLSIQSNNLESSVQSALLQIGGVLEERTDEARNLLMSAGDETVSQLTSRVDEVAVILDSRLKSMDEIVGDKGNKLIDTIDNNSRTLTANAKALEDTLNSQTNNISERLQSNASQLGAMMQQRTQELSTAFDQSGATFRENIDASLREVNETMESRTGQVSTMIESKVAEVNENLGKEIDGAIARLSDAEYGVAGKVTTAMDSIEQSTERLANRVENAVDKSTGVFDAATDHFDQTVAQRVGLTQDALTSSTSTLTQTIENFDQTVAQRVAATKEGLAASTTQFGKSFDEFDQRLAQRVASSQEGISASSDALGRTIDEKVGTLPDMISERANATAERLNEINSSVSGALDKTMSNIDEGASRIAATLEQKIVNMTSDISGDVEVTATRMDQIVRSAMSELQMVSTKLEDLVEVRGIATAQELADKASAMNRVVAVQSETLTKLIDKKAEELETRIGNHQNILSAALENSALSAEEIMARSTTKIESDVNRSLSKLNESNTLLQQVLETSGGNLSALENSIGKHTAQYSDAVRDALTGTDDAGRLMGEHVDALQSTISGLLAEVGDVKSTLEGQAHGFTDAANELTSASMVSIDTIEGGRTALEALAHGFANRAEEIDIRLRTFAQTLATSVGEAEERIAVTQERLDETVRGATNTVSNNLRTLTETAGIEGQRAQTAVQQTQQALVDEMHEAMRQATAQFNETANAMRDTAGQMNQELHATRDELQRGMLELPDETKASAAAMRRVVAEQIEALSELNNIVNAQSSSHSFTAPVSAPRREQVRQEPVRQEPIRTQPAPARPTTQRAAPAANLIPDLQTPHAASREDDISSEQIAALLERQIEQEQRHNEAPRPAPQYNPQRAAPAAQPLAQAPQAPAPSPAAPRETANTEDGDNWVRSLLRNASANQETAGNQRKASSLASLTAEIIGAVEQSALEEAWLRYQNGETGVFSRRLYTLAGQGTYDDVRKKLKRDETFAATAQEYMSEFEQLLRDAARGANPVGDTQAQLTSDRGKVYTMLAHAYGRLG